jgi:hypothetical protein
MRQEITGYGAKPEPLRFRRRRLARYPEGTRPHLGALLLGYYTDDGKLIYAGRVSTGMSDKVLADLRRPLEPLSRTKSPLSVPPPRKTRFGSPLVLSRVLLVEPKLAAEILFELDGRQHAEARGLLRIAGGQACRASAGRSGPRSLGGRGRARWAVDARCRRLADIAGRDCGRPRWADGRMQTGGLG